MMKIKPRRIVVFCLCFVMPALSAFAASPEELAGAELAAELARGELITEVRHNNPQLRLLPRHDYTRRLLEDMAEGLEATFTVESLFLYAKPRGAAAGAWSEAERTALYNGVLALSSLAGIQYFSTSRNTMRTFYETSAVIDGPETKKKLEDPFYAVPPEKLTVYANQKDLTFGDNIYQYDYYARPDALFFVQENYTPLWAGIIPAVGKQKLRSAVAVIDAGEYLLVYILSMAQTASIPGMNRRVGNSFSTRAEALLKWFSGQADQAFSGTAP
jgi:hypothetical protein